MISLLAPHALCLDLSNDIGERDVDDEGRCTRKATHEVRSPVDGSWGAYCERCAGYWAPKYVRPLTPTRAAMHFFQQAQEGERLR